MLSYCYSQLLSEEVDKVSIYSAHLMVMGGQHFILSCVFLMQAEHELRVAQTDFDRQAEVTRLLLEGINSTHVSEQDHPDEQVVMNCLTEYSEKQ